MVENLRVSESFIGEKSRSRIDGVSVFCLTALPIFFVVQTPIKKYLYILLFLTSIFYWITSKNYREPYKDIKWIALIFILYFPYSLASIWINDLSIKPADNAVHFLFFVIIAISFGQARLKKIFWYGLSCAAIVAAMVAFYQKFHLGMARPHGVYGVNELGLSGAIKFGMVAVVFTLLALQASLHAGFSSRVRCFHGFSAFVGLAGCLVIGSRGPWIALLIVAVCLLIPKVRSLSHQKPVIVAAVIFALGAVLIFGFRDLVFLRLDSTWIEIQSIRKGNWNTSIGVRLEMWKAAIEMFMENPYFGVGINQFGKALDIMVADGKAPEHLGIFYQTHNEYFQALATGGLIGFTYLILLFFLPFIYFLKSFIAINKLKNDSLPAVGGLVVVICFLIFSLTDNIFDRQMTNSLFAFLILGFSFLTAREKVDYNGRKEHKVQSE